MSIVLRAFLCTLVLVLAVLGITEVLLLLSTTYALTATGSATFFTLLPYVAKTVILVLLDTWFSMMALRAL